MFYCLRKDVDAGRKRLRSDFRTCKEGERPKETVEDIMGKNKPLSIVKIYKDLSLLVSRSSEGLTFPKGHYVLQMRLICRAAVQKGEPPPLLQGHLPFVQRWLASSYHEARRDPREGDLCISPREGPTSDSVT